MFQTSASNFPIGAHVMTQRRDKFLIDTRISQFLKLTRWDSSQKKVASGQNFVVIGSCLFVEEGSKEVLAPDAIAIIAVRDSAGTEGLLDADCLTAVVRADSSPQQEADGIGTAAGTVDTGGWTYPHRTPVMQEEAASSAAAPPETAAEVMTETEQAARARRLESQKQRRGDVKWNYSGTSPQESNQDAMQRMLIDDSHASGTSGRRQAVEAAQPNESNQDRMRRMLGDRLERARPATAVAAASAGRQCTASVAVDGASVRHYKKHLCKYWEAGHCGKGSQCTFAHGDSELAQSNGHSR